MTHHAKYFSSISTAPIVDSWIFMHSELPILSVIIFYLVTVAILSKYMKNHAACDLTFITRAYNIFQVVACLTVITKFHIAGWTFSGALSCESQLPNKSYMKILETWWICCFIRSAEFLETIFFILRKKFSQVSFLHVYHHVSSICIVWIPLKYGGSK
jgi:GNS1/SUR4 family